MEFVKSTCQKERKIYQHQDILAAKSKKNKTQSIKSMQAMDRSFELFSTYTAPHGMVFSSGEGGGTLPCLHFGFLSKSYPKGGEDTF